MRRTTSFLTLALFSVSVSTALGKLLPISFDEFKARTTCGLVVEILKTDEFRFSPPPEIPWLSSRNRVATALVERAFASDDADCDFASSRVEFLFSSEVHSAHPRQGERALVFLADSGGYLTEAVYGRSYWRIQEFDDGLYVELDWHNDFLVVPLGDSVTDDTAYLPLASIQEAWSGAEH